MCSVKKPFLKISGIHRKIPVPESTLIKFSRKQTVTQCFPVKFAKFLRALLFIEHHWWLLLVIKIILLQIYTWLDSLLAGRLVGQTPLDSIIVEDLIPFSIDCCIVVMIHLLVILYQFSFQSFRKTYCPIFYHYFQLYIKIFTGVTTTQVRRFQVKCT